MLKKKEILMSKNPETIALHGGDYRSDPATCLLYTSDAADE